jgi:hypothetical protein
VIGSRPMIERITDAAQGNHFGGVNPLGVSFPELAPPQPFAMPASPATAVLEQPSGGDRPTTSEALEAISARLIPLAADSDPARQLLIAWIEMRGKMETLFASATSERRRAIESKIAELTAAGRERLDRIKVLRLEHGASLARYNAAEENAGRLRANLQSLLDQNPDGKNTDDGWATDAERAAWQRKVDAARAALDAQNATTRLVLETINEAAGKMNAENAGLVKIREQRRLLRLELKDGTTRVLGSGLQGRTGRSALP